MLSVTGSHSRTLLVKGWAWFYPLRTKWDYPRCSQRWTRKFVLHPNGVHVQASTSRLLACWVQEPFRILVTSPTLLPQMRPEAARLFNSLKHTTVIAFRTSTIRCLVLGVLLFPTAQCSKLHKPVLCLFFILSFLSTEWKLQLASHKYPKGFLLGKLNFGALTSPWSRLCFKELFQMAMFLFWHQFCSSYSHLAES